MHNEDLKTKTRDFWQKYEHKIILIIGFILVAIISFEGGVLKGQKTAQNPLIIEKPADNNNQTVCGVSQAQNLPSEAKKDPSEISTLPQTCAFIGSKNSNKYHLPTCRYAKNINPENRVCFSSKIEAESRGYLPDKNCIK
ncbi:MAG: hypothetical protein WA055_05450 [Candidatus Moraniibacteriota bacterium]